MRDRSRAASSDLVGSWRGRERRRHGRLCGRRRRRCVRISVVIKDSVDDVRRNVLRHGGADSANPVILAHDPLVGKKRSEDDVVPKKAVVGELVS